MRASMELVSFPHVVQAQFTLPCHRFVDTVSRSPALGVSTAAERSLDVDGLLE